MRDSNRWWRRIDISRLLPTSIRKRHARKFFVGVLLVMLVTSSVGAFSYARTKHRLDSQVQDQLSSTAELQADGLNGWIAGLRRQTRTLSKAKQFQNGDIDQIDSFMVSEHGSMDDTITAVHYIDIKSGKILSSTSSNVTGKTMTALGSSWNQTMVRNHASVSSYVYVTTKPYRSPVTGEKAIAFISSPPTNTFHAVVVVASLDARAGNFYQTMDNGFTQVVDSRGRTVLNSEQNATSDVTDATISQAIAANGTGFDVEKSSLVGYAPVKGTDWFVMTHVPKASAYAIRNAVGTSLLSMLLTTLVVLGIAAVLFGRNQTRLLGNLTASAADMERGNLDTELSTNRIDEYGTLYDAFDSMRRSLGEKIANAEAARRSAEQAKVDAETAKAEAENANQVAERERREAERARATAEELSAQLEATASEYGTVMADCADGDLTRRMDEHSENESMARIAHAFNEMMDEWAATIRRVRSFSAAVANESEAATASVSEVSETGDEVSESVQEISDGAYEQNEHLQSVVVEMNDLVASIKDVSDAAQVVARRSETVTEKGAAGRESAASALTELDKIEAQTESTVEAVEELDELMEVIEEITEFITEIADRTNVLALNASIEAARAGDAGDGFAVVAAEVKGLADQTHEATKDIEASIGRVRDQTEATVEDMHETRRQVADGTETVAAALDSLEMVVDGVDETNEDVQEIHDTTEKQVESAGEVVEKVNNVATISEVTSAEAQTVAAAAEEQTVALSGVEQSVANLEGRAENLQQTMATFETEHTETDYSEDNGEFDTINDADGVSETESPEIERGTSGDESEKSDPQLTERELPKEENESIEAEVELSNDSNDSAGGLEADEIREPDESEGTDDADETPDSHLAGS